MKKITYKEHIEATNVRVGPGAIIHPQTKLPEWPGLDIHM